MLSCHDSGPESERRVLESDSDGKKTFPFDDLPAELMSRVFKWCQHDENPYFEGLTLEPVLPSWEESIRIPLLLSQVCSTWRGVAISTPALFSTIILKPITESNADGQIRLTECWLQRSRVTPLTISVEYTPETDDMSLGLPLIKALADHSHRWQTACLSISYSIYEYLVDVKGKLPKLEVLSLSIIVTRGDILRDRPNPGSSRPFEDCPSLQKVYGHFSLNADFGIVLPWDQICLLDIRTDIRSFLEILESAKLVETISAGLRPVTLAAGLVPPAPIALDSLTRLCVRPLQKEFGNDSFISPFQHMRHPNLTSLEVGDYPEATILPAFLTTLAQSSYLTHLRFAGTLISDISLLQCLRAVPSLESLEVFEPLLERKGSLTAHFFSSFTNRSGPEGICPRLTYLKGAPSGGSFDQEEMREIELVFAEMLLRRTAPEDGVERLKTVAISIAWKQPPYMHEKYLEVLRRNKASGWPLLIIINGTEISTSHELPPPPT
jgi:hypothetical protein